MRVDKWIYGERVYSLTMEDTVRVDSMEKTVVRYSLSRDNEVLFSGEDFYCSPLHDWDSDVSAGALLSFLTLGEHDTDSEYFEGYTPAQLAFRDEDPNREHLAIEAMDLENDA